MRFLKNKMPALVLLLYSGHSFSGTASSLAEGFTPTFTVISRNDDPKFQLKKDNTTAYAVPIWKPRAGGKETYSLFESGDIVVTTATAANRSDGTRYWVCPEHPLFALEADAAEADDNGVHVTFRFTPKKAGWYSVGFTGAPGVSPQEIASLWQPHVWQERRFPEKSFLSIESMCSLPAALVETGGRTIGVAADPAESPFRLPVSRNSRFGVALRNHEGLAQPMIFAPVLGGAESPMQAGKTFTFRFYIINQAGGTNDTFRFLARNLFGFRDYRENSGCSLNRTLENMIDFAMNDALSGWNADLRGSDYSTDVPGTVKNVSALHPLSVALVTDNEDIYRRRALPMTEYLLSRQKYLFAAKEGITRQGASHLMRGPAAEVSELAALYHMFGGRSEVFRHYAMELYDKPRALNLDMVSEGATWQNALALYRLKNDRTYLNKAIAGADDYISSRIENAQSDFRDVRVETGGQFWTDYSPKWVDMFELYEETGDARHLKAAAAGAQSYSMYVWMHPKVPAGNVLINPGGRVPVYNKRQIKSPQPMTAPEQMVPAWQVSQIGLTPEASRTHQENPAIMLTHYAAYMLRLGHLTKDSFLHDMGRSAVVGRNQNFPGYDINGEFTNVYARPDYPMRAYDQLTYNNIYYNHIWPHIALVMDYLLSDAFVKSDGQINFPARYAQGYAFLSSKVYGDRAGRFYGDENVRPWMPRQLLTTDNIQINYVAGYGVNSLYVALLNQSPRLQEINVTLNPVVVPFTSGQTYRARVWSGNNPISPDVMKEGRISALVAPHGITAYAIDGIKVATQFQEKVPGAAEPGTESFAVRETEIGKVTGMLLSLSPSLTNAYVWMEATPREAASALLRCRTDDRETTFIDATYPFEFSVPLSADEQEVALTLEATTTAGATMVAEPILLKQ